MQTAAISRAASPWKLARKTKAMGAALSSRAQWTSAKDKGAKLDFSKANEALLLEILENSESLCQEHPREASVIFKRPFVWTSSLVLESFQSLKSDENYDLSATGIVSKAQDSHGTPLLSVAQSAGGLEIRALNFNQLRKILNCAGAKKLKELQLCLEANQDPIATILGAAFSSHDSVPGTTTLLEVHELLSRERARGGDVSADELDSSFRLLLLLNSLDLKLLHSSVKRMGQEIRLSPQIVQSEVEVLSKFSGDSDNTCLCAVTFTSDITFANGCRAPPWRQVLGDICYIQVKPHDGSELCIAASTEGYYVIKGTTTAADYERIGDIYPNLVDLLKRNSEHFHNRLTSRDFMYVAADKVMLEPDDKAALAGKVAVPKVVTHVDDPVSTTDESRAAQRKTSLGSKKTPQCANDTSKSSAQPSPRWKSLGLGKETPITSLSSNASPQKSRGSVDLTSQLSKRKSSISSIKSRSRTSHRSTQPDSDISDSSSETSEEEEQQERRPESNADLPSEYWQIQKLIRYLKGGNQTATVIALCALLDFDLKLEASHLAIRDSGGLDLLINLLETDDVKCKIGTLKILREISQNAQTRKAIVDLGGLQMLVQILQFPNRELKCLAAETIANVAKFKRSRRIVRQNDGIKRLVDLLINPGRPNSPVTGERSDLDVARSAALGLWSCSKSRKNKIALLKTGAVPQLGKLLQCDSDTVLIPVVGTLQECASETSYQELIQSEGMVEYLVKGLKTQNEELQRHCASAIFKCAESDATRTLVREYGGLDPLVSLLSKTSNKDLLCAVTGAVWKCSKNVQNATRFKELKAIEQLVALLSNQPEEVLVNVVGGLGECAAHDPDSRASIRKAGGLVPLVQLLTGTNHSLLINTTKVVGACALDADSMIVIDKQDGVRLLWSLLKSVNPEVQACAAWAICPCIENAKDAGELVRSFVGGLELIVGLLKSDDLEVLAAVCAAIAKIAKDEENLGVLTDHGVVPLLAKLATTDSDHLRMHLCDAIARCCMWRNNRIAFGQASAVAPLVSYLQSSDSQVHRSTACALHQLSKDPGNCITMHEAGVVQSLLSMVGSTDEVLQEAAAGCIGNIRHLALANEKAKFK